MSARHGRGTRRAVCIAALASACAAATGADFRADFADTRNPPPYRALGAAERARFDLGHALLNTQWVAAGTPNAARRDGLGPVFNAASCDACHNEGARGQGLAHDGALPASIVVQLARTTPDGGDAPDPAYGHVLNPEALDGFAAEADVEVRYAVREGRYADGTPWQLREPHYEIRGLRYGALAADTAIKPRIAPRLFGVGLLERVPDALVGGAPRAADLDDPEPRPGRFGWQSATATIAEQTAVAMSREIGLTSTPVDHDDCTPAQAACRAAPSGGAPEVSPEFLAALVEFQQDLAVPRARSAAPDASALFAETGCTACHRPTLPVEGVPGLASITAYTDLRVHDLGAALADRDASGRVVPTRFRTAPLWGLDHAARRPLALLHDGRARSIEEAILWHDGEAHAVRERFERLDAGARRRLTDWLGAL